MFLSVLWFLGVLGTFLGPYGVQSTIDPTREIRNEVDEMFPRESAEDTAPRGFNGYFPNAMLSREGSGSILICPGLEEICYVSRSTRRSEKKKRDPDLDFEYRTREDLATMGQVIDALEFIEGVFDQTQESVIGGVANGIWELLVGLKKILGKEHSEKILGIVSKHLNVLKDSLLVSFDEFNKSQDKKDNEIIKKYEEKIKNLLKEVNKKGVEVIKRQMRHMEERNSLDLFTRAVSSGEDGGVPGPLYKAVEGLTDSVDKDIIKELEELFKQMAKEREEMLAKLREDYAKEKIRPVFEKSAEQVIKIVLDELFIKQSSAAEHLARKKFEYTYSLVQGVFNNSKDLLPRAIKIRERRVPGERILCERFPSNPPLSQGRTQLQGSCYQYPPLRRY